MAVRLPESGDDLRHFHAEFTILICQGGAVAVRITLVTFCGVMSAKRVGSYFVLMHQWGMVKLSRPKEIHHAPF